MSTAWYVDPSQVIYEHQTKEEQPYNDGDDMSVNYSIYVRHGKFQCEVNLPPKAPHACRSAIGRSYVRKSSAKMSAAYEACMKLLTAGQLNEYFLPDQSLRRRRRNAMNNARMAQGMGSNMYPVLLKPSVWAQDRGSVPSSLFITLIWLSGTWDRSVQPLALLTRSRLPALPRFPIYRISGDPTDVVTLTLDGTLQIDGSQMYLLTSFTLKIFKDIFNKKFEHESSQLSYWLGPFRHSVADIQARRLELSALLDLDIMSAVVQQDAIKWDTSLRMPHQDLQDRFMVDPYDGGRRLFTHSVDSNLTLNDPVPPNIAPGPRGAQTIIEYSSSLFRKSKARRHWQQDQPVVKATKILHRLNVLASPTSTEQAAVTDCYICPEPLDISPVSKNQKVVAVS